MRTLKKLINLIILAVCLGVIRGAPFLFSEIDWDIDKDNTISEKQKLMIKEDVMFKLSTEEESDCQCTKILFPIICDNLGSRHNNICEFLCNKKTNPELKPKRILLSSSSTSSEDYCKISAV